jgi:acyl-CoA thioester hydrolase
MEKEDYKLDFEVRDYECDLSGIVNNAVYQNYLEHARHMYFKTRGLDFAALEEQGVTLVVIRIEMDFLFPLRSGDKFFVEVKPERVSRLRFGFQQNIFRVPDETPILAARVIGTALNEEGRPIRSEEVEQLLARSFEGGNI